MPSNKEMNKYIDYNLLINAEKIRFQSDFSSSHWLYQVLDIYQTGLSSELKRNAFEHVIRTAINYGCKKAIEISNTYPTEAGFPTFLNLDNIGNWDETCHWILDNFEEHTLNRFSYLRDGD